MWLLKKNTTNIDIEISSYFSWMILWILLAMNRVKDFDDEIKEEEWRDNKD